MAVTQEFIDQVKEALQTFSDSLENADETGRADFIKTVAEITDSVSLPGVRYNKAPVVNGVKVNDATAEAYVQIPWSVLSEALSRMNAAAESVEDAVAGAERVDASLSGTTLTVTNRSGQQSSTDTAAESKAAKAEWDNTYKPQINTATQNANNATAGAENVNAQLNGMTVTITNRSGQSSSVEIGFDIYRTYASVAEMNADADNVPQGKFVIIATTDPTSAENARLYSRNASTAQQPFGFLSDLDQASSEAWARWLNTYQPQIVQATSDANDAAALANTKAGLADTAATNATGIYNTVRTWFNGDNDNGFRATSESWLSATQAAWDDWFSSSLATGVRKLWNDFWTSVNTSWNGFFGTSAEDTNGVRKIWSTWYNATQEAWDGWFSNSLATGVRKLWSDFWTSINSSWEDFFGTSAEDTNGVRKIWSTWYNATQTAWNIWFGTSASSGVQKDWSDLASDAADDHTRAVQDHSTAEDDHTRAENDHSTATQDHGTADTDHTRAENDHSTATQDHGTADTDHTRAENDHSTATQDHGTADTDHTRAENDHSTATQDHGTADTDHTRAENDHSTATQDHGTADTDHTRAENDHSTATQDHATAGEDHTQAVTQTELMEAWNEHLPYVADGTAAHPGDLNYWYVYDPSAEHYVKGPYAKGDNLDWGSMTPEEKQALADEVLAAIGFDDVPTPNSNKAVKSGGIYNALQSKQNTLTFASDALCEQAAEEIVFTVSN